MVPLLFADCIPVRGARKAVICDLGRETWYPIPLALHEILTEHRGKTLDEIKALFPAPAHEVIDEYFEHLFAQGLAWLCDDPERFPPMELEWDHPGVVSNALIDVGPYSDHDWESLFGQLAALGCQSVQLRFFTEVSAGTLDHVLRPTLESTLRYLELLVPDSPLLSEEALRELMARHQRVNTVFIHSAPENRVAEGTALAQRIVYRTDVVTSAEHCGQVHPAYFMASIPLFTEGQRHNTCLNRKVSVDEHGQIRNCPAMPRAFGAARDTPLARVVARGDFQAPWGVTKDQVSVCRDCEFRYVCTDCRALVADPGDPLSKPLRCGYDPYTANWNAAPTPEVLRATAGALA